MIDTCLCGKPDIHTNTISNNTFGHIYICVCIVQSFRMFVVKGVLCMLRMSAVGLLKKCLKEDKYIFCHFSLIS